MMENQFPTAAAAAEEQPVSENRVEAETVRPREVADPIPAREEEAAPTLPQTPEERHRQAARRRAAETNEKIRAAVQQAEEKLRGEMQERLDAVLSEENAPAVPSSHAPTEAEQALLARDMEIIAGYDPTVKTVNDLLKMPNADAFVSLVEKGLSFSEAYRLVNFDTILHRQAQAVKQSAARSAFGKSHLTPAGVSRGSASRPVPPAEMRYFRAVNPEATDEEIERYYNRT